MKSITEIEKARFDARISVQEKQLFERAATIAGYRSLTDFIVKTVKAKAEKIIKKHELVVKTKKDSQIFINEILNPKPPNAKLIKAAQKFMDKD